MAVSRPSTSTTSTTEWMMHPAAGIVFKSFDEPIIKSPFTYGSSPHIVPEKITECFVDPVSRPTQLKLIFKMSLFLSSYLTTLLGFDSRHGNKESYLCFLNFYMVGILDGKEALTRYCKQMK